MFASMVSSLFLNSDILAKKEMLQIVLQKCSRNENGDIIYLYVFFFSGQCNAFIYLLVENATFIKLRIVLCKWVNPPPLLHNKYLSLNLECTMHHSQLLFWYRCILNRNGNGFHKIFCLWCEWARCARENECNTDQNDQRPLIVRQNNSNFCDMQMKILYFE